MKANIILVVTRDSRTNAEEATRWWWRRIRTFDDTKTFTREFWHPDIHNTQLMAAVRSNNLCTNENQVLLCGAVNKRNFIFINYVFLSSRCVEFFANSIKCSSQIDLPLCPGVWITVFPELADTESKKAPKKQIISKEKIMQESCVQ